MVDDICLQRTPLSFTRHPVERGMLNIPFITDDSKRRCSEHIAEARGGIMQAATKTQEASYARQCLTSRMS